MCFSAPVSFIAGSSLSLVGLLSVSRATSLRQRMLAAIPLFFGIQQIAEGIVWRGLEANNQQLIMYGGYTFLLFALFVWPAWVPLSLYYVEEHKKRRQVLKFFTVFGIGLGTYLFNFIVRNGITVQEFSCHILYQLGFTGNELLNTVLYLIATVVPFFIVARTSINLLGIVIALSYLFTYFFYTQVLVSVWCFFAAIISFFVIYIVYELQQGKK